MFTTPTKASQSKRAAVTMLQTSTGKAQAMAWQKQTALPQNRRLTISKAAPETSV